MGAVDTAEKLDNPVIIDQLKSEDPTQEEDAGLIQIVVSTVDGFEDRFFENRTSFRSGVQHCVPRAVSSSIASSPTYCLAFLRWQTKAI